MSGAYFVLFNLILGVDIGVNLQISFELRWSKLKERSSKVIQLIGREAGVKPWLFWFQTCGFPIALQCTQYFVAVHLFYLLV